MLVMVGEIGGGDGIGNGGEMVEEMGGGDGIGDGGGDGWTRWWGR